jgi:hypothetical protein
MSGMFTGQEPYRSGGKIRRFYTKKKEFYVGSTYNFLSTIY